MLLKARRVFTRWTGDVHAHAGYNTLEGAVINRRQKMFKVCRWESPAVSRCRQERVGWLIHPRWLAITRWDHRLSVRASTQISPQPWRKRCTLLRNKWAIQLLCTSYLQLLVRLFWGTNVVHKYTLYKTFPHHSQTVLILIAQTSTFIQLRTRAKGQILFGPDRVVARPLRSGQSLWSCMHAPGLRLLSWRNGVHKERQHWSRKPVYMFKLWRTKATNKVLLVLHTALLKDKYGLFKETLVISWHQQNTLISNQVGWQKKHFDHILNNLLFDKSICWLQIPPLTHVTVVWLELKCQHYKDYF